MTATLLEWPDTSSHMPWIVCHAPCPNYMTIVTLDKGNLLIIKISMSSYEDLLHPPAFPLRWPWSVAVHILIWSVVTGTNHYSERQVWPQCIFFVLWAITTLWWSVLLPCTLFINNHITNHHCDISHLHRLWRHNTLFIYLHHTLFHPHGYCWQTVNNSLTRPLTSL